MDKLTLLTKVAIREPNNSVWKKLLGAVTLPFILEQHSGANAGVARHVTASPGWRRAQAERWPHVKTLIIRFVTWMGNLYILSIYVMINKKCAALRMYKCMGGLFGPPKNVCRLQLHKICAALGRTKFVSAVYRQNGNSRPK